MHRTPLHPGHSQRCCRREGCKRPSIIARSWRSFQLAERQCRFQPCKMRQRPPLCTNYTASAQSRRLPFCFGIFWAYTQHLPPPQNLLPEAPLRSALVPRLPTAAPRHGAHPFPPPSEATLPCTTQLSTTTLLSSHCCWRPGPTWPPAAQRRWCGCSRQV